MKILFWIFTELAYETEGKYLSNRLSKEMSKNNFAECSALILIITMIWSLICGIKGIWPLGQNLLDIGDMSEQNVPMYIHLWDVIHGRKSLLFDWYTGLGNNMAGRNCILD